MKFLPFIFLFAVQLSDAQISFNDWFTSGRMRVDYVLAGNDNSTSVYLSRIYHEAQWGGSQTQLLDTMFCANYHFVISDSVSGKELYSRGFNTLYGEWQTTAEAKVENKSFMQSLIFPRPLNTVKLEIFHLITKAKLNSIYQTYIDPSNILIRGTEIPSYENRDIFISGPSEEKVDLLFVAEGYTKHEMKKFLKDVRRFTSYLFSVEPYKSNKEKFNVRAVLSPSIDSGADVPGEGIWRNTRLNSSYYTFGTDRYLTTEDYWALMDAVSGSVYDHLVVLVNTTRYGGGGIFNYYAITTAGNKLSPKVFVHEFGHSFGALGDEYYSSGVAYSDFFPLEYEPLVPNLTTLVDFSSKWEDMLEENIPVPTPAVELYAGKTGVFEGGGYAEKGIYRPSIDCRMKSNEASEFCRVCQRSLQRMIDFYSR